jgi:hypothetical protein
VERANANGGRDNVTVVIVDVTEAAAAPFDDTDTAFVTQRPRVVADEVTGEFEVIPSVDSTSDNDPEHDETPVDGASHEALHNTADNEPDTDAPADRNTRRTPRRSDAGSRLTTFLAGVALTALVVIALAIGAAWARGTYSVGFTNTDRVMIYRGRDVLWFNPTEEAPGPYLRSDLDPESVRYVEAEPTFDSLDAAADFIANTLTPADADTDDE